MSTYEYEAGGKGRSGVRITTTPKVHTSPTLKQERRTKPHKTTHPPTQSSSSSSSSSPKTIHQNTGPKNTIRYVDMFSKKERG
ncbi:hypothetical protein PGT21_033646 [Puccinia graminis f. sp. tritici]|uniref:Uncharacterized protein n=1 Tax=Puccinia graminis f. sp. tritici TaxID=56615 RepID=A0A5B0PZM5_PUCGR|nr:hypothetical protein PGT21_033646 [Puccinia graminis f. sp. tritici]